MAKFLSIAYVLGLTLTTSAAAGTDAAVRTSLGAWTMICEPDAGGCVLLQVRGETNHLSPAQIEVEVARRGETVDVRVATPLVAEPKLRLRFPSQRTMFLKDPTCGESACEFNVTLDRTALDELTSERRVELAVTVGPDQEVALVFDLRGLAEALEHLPPRP